MAEKATHRGEDAAARARLVEQRAAAGFPTPPTDELTLHRLDRWLRVWLRSSASIVTIGSPAPQSVGRLRSGHSRTGPEDGS